MTGNDSAIVWLLLPLIVGIWGAGFRIQKVEKRLAELERRLKEKGVLPSDD